MKYILITLHKLGSMSFHQLCIQVNCDPDWMRCSAQMIEQTKPFLPLTAFFNARARVNLTPSYDQLQGFRGRCIHPSFSHDDVPIFTRELLFGGGHYNYIHFLCSCNEPLMSPGSIGAMTLVMAQGYPLGLFFLKK